MTKDLYIIKKKYGEEMAHYCRENFSSILEKEGLLSSLLKEHFEGSHELYHDLESNHLLPNFDQYIYSFTKEKKTLPEISKTPKELLESVGYQLYECKTEEDIQSFKKYYAKEEELCTFYGGRLKTNYVFFAVKKNVDEIKRENFPNPERQDEYGTSVISIQFDRKTYRVSIKNRYNHTVNNPDSTFSNNLENIVKGLTKSFEKAYGFSIKEVSNFEIPNYVNCNNKYYKYNYEINNNCYCVNNIFIKENQAFFYEKERYILFDYYLLDLKEKKISYLDDTMKDSFINTIGNIQKIKIEKEKENKKIIIENEKGKQEIVVNKNNQMISYQNNEVKEIENYFCYYNKTLKEVDLPNAKLIGDSFLRHNISITEISLPHVETIGDDFLYYNETITKIDLPNVKEIGSFFLCCNGNLEEIDLSNVQIVGNKFLVGNKKIKKINLSNVQIIGDHFLFGNKKLEKINLPNAKIIGDDFLYNNEGITEMSLPHVKTIGNDFLHYNERITKISLPHVKTIGNYFLYYNEGITEMSLPHVETIGDCFLYYNEGITKINLSNAKIIGSSFLYHNKSITEMSLPNVQVIEYFFLSNNKLLKELRLPEVQIIKPSFCQKNESLRVFEAPKLKYIDSDLDDVFYKEIPLDVLVLNEEWVKKNLPLILTYKKNLLLQEKMNQIKMSKRLV